MDDYRAGFVALLGPPNAGKSSLLNALLGQPLAIVSAKPQTTRSRILGILPREGAQILFLDTPGRHASEKKLNQALNAVVEQASRDCDVALLVIDRTIGWTPTHAALADELQGLGRPTVLVGTKSDRKQGGEAPWPPPDTPSGWPSQAVSARTEEGLEALVEAILSRLPVSPPLYDEDALTDRPMRWLCGEMIREALFERLSEELPYSMAVEVLRYDESSRKAVRIGANLLVERESQKRIVVGKGGEMVKSIGIRARAAIEGWVGRQVHLELFVKVDPGWLKNDRRIAELGYH